MGDSGSDDRNPNLEDGGWNPVARPVLAVGETQGY